MTILDPGWAASHPEDADDWARWQTNPLQQVDFAVHIHYLRSYLSRDDRVLEVGAGAGRFTREIAEIVDRMTVVDISEEKLQRNQRYASALGYSSAVEAWRRSDMRDLSQEFSDGEYDAVVCFGGPLSYVYDLREQALRELVRVTRPGGLLLLSARSLWGMLHENLPRMLNAMDPHMMREVIKTGDLGPSPVAPVDRYWHAYRSTEFRDFIEQSGLEVLVISASNCLTSTWTEMLSSLREDEAAWKRLLELEIQASQEPGCLDIGTHILAVALKA